jgi:hypothetical protein
VATTISESVMAMPESPTADSGDSLDRLRAIGAALDDLLRKIEQRWPRPVEEEETSD